MRALFFLVLLSLSPAAARADAISEPPSCPPHSEPIFCHGPPTCGPRECLSSDDCAPGENCAVVDLCVEEHGCGGGWGGPGVSRTHVFGVCGAGDTCAEGTCAGQFVCVPGPVLEDGGPRPDAARVDASGVDAGDGRTHSMYGCDCGCSVGASPRNGGSPWSVLLLASLVGWVRRRRSARRDSQTTSRVSG